MQSRILRNFGIRKHNHGNGHQMYFTGYPINATSGYGSAYDSSVAGRRDQIRVLLNGPRSVTAALKGTGALLRCNYWVGVDRAGEAKVPFWNLVRHSIRNLFQVADLHSEGR